MFGSAAMVTLNLEEGNVETAGLWGYCLCGLVNSFVTLMTSLVTGVRRQLDSETKLHIQKVRRSRGVAYLVREWLKL